MKGEAEPSLVKWRIRGDDFSSFEETEASREVSGVTEKWPEPA
jgi:hypothetical protein